ncbi:MAG: alpha/beta hydrolase [Acidimicrobiales bacterium]
MPAELTLRTADAISLEAQWNAPDGEARAVAVLCHPHPLYGGSMHAGVIDELFWALPAQGVAALRFNFRGVEGSGGEHGKGVAERQDVAAAVAEAAQRAQGAPVFVAAWSFGADVSLCTPLAELAGWFLIAPPLSVQPLAEMAEIAADPRPKRLAQPEHDQFNPPPKAAAATAGWTNTEVAPVPGADHFLMGHGSEVIRLAVDFAGRLS